MAFFSMSTGTFQVDFFACDLRSGASEAAASKRMYLATGTLAILHSPTFWSIIEGAKGEEDAP